MEYKFLDSSIEKDNIILPNSDKINPFLLKNNYTEIIKAVDFIASEEKFLYIHGFMGTGKRQFINYVCEFCSRDIIKLEYYCKESTVCDDILLSFIDIIEENPISKAINVNTKISTLNTKFKQYVSSIKKPFLIILHSLDDVLPNNIGLITEVMESVGKEENVKLIVSSRALKPGILGDLEENRKVFLKAFSKAIFKEYLQQNQIKASDKTVEDFYKYTRGYYFYSALSVKILQSMNIDLNEFLQKFNQSGMSFDSFLGATYVNLVPSAIRNFFWFLRTVRHGLTLNALAVLELYDEYSIEYLKTNLMIFQSGETLYVQDYFLQRIDISIPVKTEIKLHKYIVNIYENQLKQPIKNRCILISRQALRAEIEYHNNQVVELENDTTRQDIVVPEGDFSTISTQDVSSDNSKMCIASMLNEAEQLVNDKRYTEAIESYIGIAEDETIDLPTLIEVRLKLANLYKTIDDYPKANHYFELVEAYYKNHNENINLNYLYYAMTDLYYKMYKNDRAIETIKKVIYSVDTPQSLMVNACTLLGNIYSDINNPQEAFSYYQKALQSLDDNVSDLALAELYFKFALANDEKEDETLAFEYYNKCIAISGENPYKALAYSNMASCYYDNESFDEARNCFLKAYDIEKKSNNYDGIYYTAYNLAKILLKTGSKKALDFLIEAKKSAEFINEDFYIMQSSIALGDYYYNLPQKSQEGLIEYLKAWKVAQNLASNVDIVKIEQRIQDMKLRMKQEEFEEIFSKYGK